MAEMPDFKANADKIKAFNIVTLTHPDNHVVLEAYLLNLQREIWNARGEADLTAIADSHDKYEADNRENYELAIRKLDR